MSDLLTLGAEPAVRVRNLRKVYRLYKRPSYRLRDIMGFLPDDPRYFDQHVALHDVNFEIGRGEKVAIIGRNGAGKSTLLRLITNVIEPTSGSIEISGQTRALLSLGTGFHPELTGRQNVLAYLANFGIAGQAAARMVDDVIDFSELEEYIDQPTKTYSTGMGMRLMFSASTMFVPDLLVIDEVLGVGDAYFQSKSFDRIREICSGQGTTLLLVTHDVYAATSLCERTIWIDHGSVLLDADSPTVMKAYDTSIRQQEEARLRKKALLSLGRLAENAAAVQPLLIELRSPDNAPPAAGIALGRIALCRGETEIAAAPLADAGVAASLDEGGAWGDIVDIGGRPAREMRNFGSSVHKVSVSFSVPRDEDLDALSLEIEAVSKMPYRLAIWRIGKDLDGRAIGEIAAEAPEWSRFRLSLAGEPDAAQPELVVRAADNHGSGRVTVTAIRLVDAAGNETYQLAHGEPASVVIDYQVNDPGLKEACQIVLAFRRNATDDMLRLYCPALPIDGSAARQGQIVARLDRLPLGAAEYSITALIAGEGYYESNPTLFYSINPNVYWAGRNVIDFKVTSDHLITQGTGAVVDAVWLVRTTAEPSRAG